MRNFLDVLRFELRQQCSSPLFAALLLLFFVIHLLTIAEVGISINDNELLDYNSVFMIFRAELVLGLFGMLPALIFVVNAAVRDHSHATAELIYATPVGRLSFLLARLSGGTLCALAVALAGVLGTAAGSFMPWLAPQRVAPFAWQGYAVCFAVLVVPNTLVFCVFSFCVAALSRAAVLSFAVALLFIVLGFVLNTQATGNDSPLLAALDPFGGLAVAGSTHFWSVLELNTRLPVAALPANRMLWLALAALALAATCWRFRLELGAAASGRSRGRELPRSMPPSSPQKRHDRELPSSIPGSAPQRRHDRELPSSIPGSAPQRRHDRELPSSIPGSAPQRRHDRELPSSIPGSAPQRYRGSFAARDTVAQFVSQLRMDLRAVLTSPLFLLVVVLVVGSTVSEVQGASISLTVKLPLHPVTSHMLGFFRAALFQFALVVIVFYSALLLHREREHRLHEILGASPYPDWITLTSKVLTLCLVVLSLLLASMLACIALQLGAGYYHIELGVYLQSLFVNTGFYFCMFCVLACVLQALVPGKWSGMLVVFCALVALLVLPALGLEHLLYGFRIPYVVYTDMNGFGHFLPRMYSLIVYWGAFCVLLLVAGNLLLPRGADAGLLTRLRGLRARLSPATRVTAAAAAAVFVLAGGWIFYNTNVLNEYLPASALWDRQADYERRYSAYADLPAVSPVDMTLNVDLYPAQRRLVSRGRMSLRNRQTAPLEQLVISADPLLRFDELEIQGGTPMLRDESQGFFVFRLEQPLLPGEETQLTWSAVRHHRGFSNGGAETDIVANGTFVDSTYAIPVPAYVRDRELDVDKERKRRGLPPMAGLPALGDVRFLNTHGRAVESALTYRVTLSTDADQIAVAPGELRREWLQGGRRYFEYAMDQPIGLRVSLQSARYAVARDEWNGVPIEVYHDPKHAWNVGTMLSTSKQGLAYYSGEFAPYLFRSFRIVEYPGYEDHAQAFPGTVPYTETVGFLTDLRGWAPLDPATAHELAHMWWGGLEYGAYMQGRKILNEGMAEYSSLMLLKQQRNPLWLRRTLSSRHDAYLHGRSAGEVPVVRAEDEHAHLTYGKSAHVVFALQELLGADTVHLALRNFLDRFALKPPPFPTSLDLVKELRAVAGPEYQDLITDLFEKIVLYDVQMKSVEATPAGDGYDVTLHIEARQFEFDGAGAETEVPVRTPFQVVVFPESNSELLARTPLYQAFHQLQTGAQRLTVHVQGKPAAAGVDPFHLMFDRTPNDNTRTAAP